uniref:28S ribosomal protein S17, mitochondrial n=1 Tax=Steinernema glaseri TaxID=37863 RepID=A0A1I7ZPA9_9BILA
MSSTSIFKSRVGTDLLMGRVVKVSRIGLDKVPCAQVRCQRNEFNIYLKKYFARSFDYWAMDASNLVGLGDTVLIKQMEKVARPMATVRHAVDRVVFQYGNIVDPVTGRRVIEDQFEDEMTLRQKLVAEIVEDPFKEESLLFDERRAVQKEKLEEAKQALQKEEA